MTSKMEEQHGNHHESQIADGGGFTGSSIASLAPRNTYVTYDEVLDADKRFFDLVEEKKCSDVRQLIHKYNG